MVCLRKDHPLAAKAASQASDLQDNLTIIYHPQRHPEARVRLLELLGNAGVTLEDYSCASHPSDVQTLAKEGHGIALIREGTLLEEGLITRRLAGVDWTVDTAVIYDNARHQCVGRTETLEDAGVDRYLLYPCKLRLEVKSHRKFKSPRGDDC